MEKTLIIMQGVSGSGKSFVTDALKQYYYSKGIEVSICSTDNYWYRNDPNTYEFDINKLSEAHAFNRKMAEHNMKNNCPIIIIDNTNTTQKEANPYIEMANEYSYTIRIISVSCSLSTAITHNNLRTEDRKVPESIIIAQHSRITHIKI